MLFIVFHSFIYFGLTKWLEYDQLKSRPVCITAIIVYAVSLIIYFIFCRKPIDVVTHHPHQGKLLIILLVLFILECFWVVFVIKRRKLIDVHKENTNSAPDTFHTGIGRLMSRLGIRKSYIIVEEKYFRIFSFVGLLSLFFYLLAIFNITIAIYMGTLAFVLLAFGILVSIINFISFFSIRWSINLFFLLFVWAVIFGKIWDPYKVKLVDTEKPVNYNSRLGTKEYLDLWFERRLKLMSENTVYKGKSNKFDVYIVLSNGGASRAGYWAGAGMSSLQDISYQADPSNSFKEHLLCIAGASGGSVGNAAFYALLKAAHDKKISPGKFSVYNDSFFMKDFLVFPIARLLGPDLLQHFLPLGFVDNHADALERSFSEAMMESDDRPEFDRVLKGYFKMPLSEVFDNSGDLPILYMNLTEVDNGGPALITNTKRESSLVTSGDRVDVLSLVDKQKSEEKDSLKDIKLSTAAVLSSRFPYVSPAGKIYNKYFVDGGYFDNSGARTVFEFIGQLRSFLSEKEDALGKSKNEDDQKKLERYRRFTFHIVHFNNSEKFAKPVNDVHPLNNDLAAPLLTLVGIQGSNTTSGNSVLKSYFDQPFFKPGCDTDRPKDNVNGQIEYNLYDELDSIPQPEETYPMSWAISEHNMARMRNALKRENERKKKSFYFRMK